VECPLLRPHPTWRQRSGGLTVGRSEYHEPVMADRVVSLVSEAEPAVIVDATFGGGGHTRELLNAMPTARVVALDRDPDADPADRGQADDRISFHVADFRRLGEVLEEEGLDEIDAAVFDLGVSSHQLDVGERGFSFRRRGPLDMRMGPDAEHTAADIVNGWDERDLARVIRRHGDERHARRIAAAIVRERPIDDTERLAEVVAGAVPAGSHRRIHPATRTFQALRIAVNDELSALADGLDVAVRMLRPGGRIVVISYHSGEDRIVKRRFARGADGCVCPPDLPVCGCGAVVELRLITRRPERPSAAEIDRNPRSRSARLRAAEKVAPPPGGDAA
jgi:16S rRNA (cytosine1402-N4)-methyltransferase